MYYSYTRHKLWRGFGGTVHKDSLMGYTQQDYGALIEGFLGVNLGFQVSNFGLGVSCLCP